MGLLGLDTEYELNQIKIKAFYPVSSKELPHTTYNTLSVDISVNPGINRECSGPARIGPEGLRVL
jgi:hypothetical protein